MSRLESEISVRFSKGACRAILKIKPHTRAIAPAESKRVYCSWSARSAEIFSQMISNVALSLHISDNKAVHLQAWIVTLLRVTHDELNSARVSRPIMSPGI